MFTGGGFCTGEKQSVKHCELFIFGLKHWECFDLC